MFNSAEPLWGLWRAAGDEGGFIVFLRVGINPVAMGEIQLEFQLLRDLFSLRLQPKQSTTIGIHMV